MFNTLFQLRGELPRNTRLALEVLGVLILLLLWWLLALYYADFRYVDGQGQEIYLLDDTQYLNEQGDTLRIGAGQSFDALFSKERTYPLLPVPSKVFAAYPSLLGEDKLLDNVGLSVYLNVMGYVAAIAIAIPLGFLVGLLPLFNGLFQRQIDAVRFIPLSAITGLFIVWFGIANSMKISFLAFGIVVYLLPVVVQRIREVEDVYLKTVFTLGANAWQTIRSVYLPSVLSRLFDDVRVLTAISWTYIIIAELVNATEGGVGALIWRASRQGRVDKVFAVLLVIVLIGILQDRLFYTLDKIFFPFKSVHQGKKK